MAALHRTGHESWNSCFTDFATPAALARLIEGPVGSLDDLQGAETALQALMWHERVDVLVPAFKVQHSGGLLGYARERDPRTQLAFDLFSPAAAYDQMFVVEQVDVEDGEVRASNVSGSGITGLRLEDARNDYLNLSPFQAAVLSEIPNDFAVPAYFSHPRLYPFTGLRGYFDTFYTSVGRQWDEAMKSLPDVAEVIPVPPLTAIVLDRAPSREALPEVILQLRAELEPVRLELVGFNDMLRGAYNQIQVEERSRYIKESFEATFKASRMTYRPLLLPFLKVVKAAKSPLDTLITALNPEYVPGDPRILIDRTVTAKKFAKLLKVDAMHSLLNNTLKPDELAALGRAASRRRKV